MKTTEQEFTPTRGLRKRYGDVSHMWVERRLADDPEFPRPIYIGRQRYWRIAELVEWERKRAAGKPVKQEVA